MAKSVAKAKAQQQKAGSSSDDDDDAIEERQASVAAGRRRSRSRGSTRGDKNNKKDDDDSDEQTPPRKRSKRDHQQQQMDESDDSSSSSSSSSDDDDDDDDSEDPSEDSAEGEQWEEGLELAKNLGFAPEQFKEVFVLLEDLGSTQDEILQELIESSAAKKNGEHEAAYAADVEKWLYNWLSSNAAADHDKKNWFLFQWLYHWLFSNAAAAAAVDDNEEEEDNENYLVQWLSDEDIEFAKRLKERMSNIPEILGRLSFTPNSSAQFVWLVRKGILDGTIKKCKQRGPPLELPQRPLLTETIVLGHRAKYSKELQADVLKHFKFNGEEKSKIYSYRDQYPKNNKLENGVIIRNNTDKQLLNQPVWVHIEHYLDLLEKADEELRLAPDDLTDEQIQEKLDAHTKRTDNKPFTHHDVFLNYFFGGDLPKMKKQEIDNNNNNNHHQEIDHNHKQALVGVAVSTALFASCMFSVHNMVTRA